MRKFKSYLVALLLLCIAGIARGQALSQQEHDALYGPLLKTIRVPRSENCKSQLVMVVLPVKNNGIGEPEFSKDCPPALQEEFSKALKKMDPALLNREVHGKATANDYHILMPFILSSDRSCEEVIKPEDFQQKLSNGLTISRKTPLYLMEPIIIISGKPIP